MVGWRIRASSLEAALGGFALLLLFAYACRWMMALVGLMGASAGGLQQRRFMVIFPLTFLVERVRAVETLPPALQTFAEWNPVSAVTQAARELFGNTSPRRRCLEAGRCSIRSRIADLDCDHPDRVRAVGINPVQEGRQPLTAPTSARHRLR